MKRFEAVDICRGILFVLMTNTHALTLSEVSREHWLFSDIWLPNGWATQAFVVLTGFGLTLFCSDVGHNQERQLALRNRAFQILAVMIASNLLFGILADIAAGDSISALDQAWWKGMLTLETPYSISGILLPTALVVLLARFIVPVIYKIGLLGFPLLLLLEGWVGGYIRTIGDNDGTLIKLLFLEGLGGFPVLPFLLHGIWGMVIGSVWRKSKTQGLTFVVLLGCVQCFNYAFALDAAGGLAHFFSDSTSAARKFSVVFLIALLIDASKYFSYLASPLALIGKYALGSFILHRIFLQGYSLIFGLMGLVLISSMHYAILFIIALISIWIIARLREHIAWFNSMFKKIYL